MKKVLPIFAILSFLASVFTAIAKFAFKVNIPLQVLIGIATISLFIILLTIGEMKKTNKNKEKDSEPMYGKNKTDFAEDNNFIESSNENCANIKVDEAVINSQSSPKVEDKTKNTGFTLNRYKRSYMSKLIQSNDELKGYYSKIKNAFMSYDKVDSKISKGHERIRFGKQTLAIIKLRGKTLLLYLPLDSSQYQNTVYAGENVSNITKYSEVPFLYRVNGPRKAARAARLIDVTAEKFLLEEKKEKACEDYVKLLPYEDDKALISKGLIIDTKETQK